MSHSTNELIFGIRNRDVYSSKEPKEQIKGRGRGTPSHKINKESPPIVSNHDKAIITK